MEKIVKDLCENYRIVEDISRIRPVHGGCINHCFHVQAKSEEVFVKINDASAADFFEKEALGLQLLESTGKISVPQVIKHGTFKNSRYLILSYIEKSAWNEDSWRMFGRSLASLHQVSSNSFGLDYPNYIGAYPQVNEKANSWSEFFIESRIKPLLQTPETKKLNQDFEQLYLKLPSIFPSEVPALLHGDLWSGNILCGPQQQPFVVDPAVYFGNREMDLAFSMLFGGFPDEFYQAYEESFPLQPDFNSRRDLYNLYPLLVHHHLFGGSYLNQVIRTLKNFI